MLKNHFKIAVRNILRHKGYAAINIIGLAVGTAACMLIYMYVNRELSFDKFNSHSKNMYRLVFDYKFPDKLDHLAVAAPIAGISVKKSYPEVINYTSISPYSGKLLVKYKDKKFYEENIYVADSTFFQVFDYKLISGDRKTLLNEPNVIAIDESMAKKYFGTEEPLGKVLEYDNGDGTFASYKVTGVFENVPGNSHLVFNSLVSYKTLEKLFGAQGLNSWHNAGSFVYLQLKENTDVKAFENKICHMYDKYADQYKNVNARISMYLEPIGDIHLRSDRLFDSAVKGNLSYVYIFSAVAFFLLLIACINYINLSTAQGKTRMKEIGVRKVIGAEKKNLIGQFTFQSALIVFCAVLLAQLLLLAFLPVFNDLTGMRISVAGLFSGRNLLFLVLLFVSVILLAGIYPAFYLTSFIPVTALKGGAGSGEKGTTLRKVLVVAQFTISIILIASTIIVRSQVGYMLDHDPGFNKSNVISIRFQDTLTVTNYFAIKNEMLKIPGVKKVAQSSTLPGDPPDRKITRIEARQDGVINEIPIEPIWVDQDYFDLMQVHLKEGRLFDKAHAIDSKESFIVNESATKIFNWDKNIGKHIIWGGGGRQRDGHVIGVVNDIYTGSLKNKVDPIVFVCADNPGKAYTVGFMLIRTDNTNQENTIKEICATWSSFDKEHPVEYKFLDEKMTELYNSEQKTNRLFQYLSLLTIFIACLGLFGLVSFSVSQRVKEIGVRKVLGASAGNVTILLSKDFLKLILLAFVIAIPCGWFMMHHWLQDFAFRISIKWWMFLFAGCIAFAVALITVFIQAMKAARANPVKSLRTE